jgi:ABC-type multidrug transport system ATPase subunit
MEGVRISVDHATAVADVSLTTRGSQVLFLGDSLALMALLTSTPWTTPTGLSFPRLEAGRLRLRGCDFARGWGRDRLGVAPRDPPLCDGWSAQEYLAWSAQLMGDSQRAAGRRVAAVLDRLELGAIARHKLESLVPAARRALMLAAAILRDPPTLVADGPFDDLTPEEAAELLPVWQRAVAARALIVSSAQVALSGPSAAIFSAASDVCLLRAGLLVAHESPAALLRSDRYEITVLEGGERLGPLLSERGIAVLGGPYHFVLTLPPATDVSDVLAAAVAARAVVVRCAPVVGGRTTAAREDA